MIWEYIILGAVQGITEWLPISSEGMMVLAQVWLFGQDTALTQMIELALFFHLGSFLAVIIYFWSDLVSLLKTIPNYRQSSVNKSLFNFLVITSLISGTVGYLIYKIISQVENQGINLTGASAMVLVGLLLLVTSYLQFKSKNLPGEDRDENELNLTDGIILGLVQSAAVLPGLSRSGSTISVLLLRKIKDTTALKVSFLMSLPIILGGNFVLNRELLVLNFNNFIGLLSAFVFSLITIHLLIKIAEKLSFAWFTLFFGIFTILAGLISFLV